ncbi:MAG: hypothetical protein JWQ44_228 [Chthoniobacter sp.]|nr:hypothetical protein [Chthoniobacter sp.]
MMSLNQLFSTGGFIPHGQSYLPDANVMWLHIVSDALIALAYFAIPMTMIYIGRRRKNLPFDGMFAWFGVFILACGATHALEILNIWQPLYRFSGVVKAFTALASIICATVLIRMIPRLIAMPSLAKMQESEERFSGAFEHAPIGVALVSPEGGWIKVNRALCELVGYSEAELLKGRFQDITHPEDLERDMEHLRGMLTGEIAIYEIEKRYLHRQGHVVPVQLNVSLVRDVRGQPRYFISQIQDIAARKQAEARQRAEEERYLRQRNALINVTRGGALSGDDLSGTMRRLTETSAATLGAARVSVWRYNEERTAIRCVDLYEREADRHTAGMELSAADYPAYFRALATQQVIAAEDAHLDPRTSEFAENYSRPSGITSMLDAPIHLGGAAEGVLCHEHVGPPRRWTGDEETFAVAVANVASLALEGSERQRAEQQLRESEGRYRAVVEWSPQAMIVHRGVQVLFANSAAVAMFGGTSLQDLAGKPVLDLVHPDSRQLVLERIRSHADPGAIHPMAEQRLLKLDGTPIDAEVRGTSISFGGEPAILASIQDVTERKRAAEDLAASEELLRQFIRHSPAAIAMLDTQMRYVQASERWIQDYQLTGEEIIGRGHYEIFPHMPQRWKDASQRVLAGAIERCDEDHFTQADGSVDWLQWEARPWRDASGEIGGLIFFTQVITGRKRAEAETERLSRQLIGLSRQAGMAEVATSVLHNVGNVLNSVNISAAQASDKVRHSCGVDLLRVAALLEEHRDDLPKFLGTTQGAQLPGFITALADALAAEQRVALEELGSLTTHIDHIKEIVAMQQTYARIAPMIEDISPVSLVENALQMNGAALEQQGVEIVREYAGARSSIRVDKHKALQILVNLIQNAGHALADGETDRKRLILRIREDDGTTVEIEVADEGVGIPAGNLTRIFEHGFTTRKEGHGFGLHSAALAAQELGGLLSVQSDGPGKGAVFTLALPMQGGVLKA